MSAPVLDLGGGWALRAPVSVLTNVVLAGQALWLTRASAGPRLLSGLGDPSLGQRSGWGLALRLLAISTAAGALKHATGPGVPHELARLTSNLSAGMAVLAPTWIRAVRAALPKGRLRVRWRGLACRGALLAAFAAFSVTTLVEPSFLVVTGFALVAVAPAVALEARAALRGRSDARRVLAGLTIAAVAGLTYLLRIRLGPWIGPVDVAHLGLMGAFPLLAAGHRESRGCVSHPSGAIR